MFFSKIIIFAKRTLSGRLYLLMMVSLILLSIIYALLPARIKTTDICVGLYIEDTDYADELFTALTTSNSIYTYTVSSSLEELRENVESQKFECGFFIPDGFFQGYIKGLADCPKIVRYETASTTLGSAVTESVFSQIFKLCAADILYLAYDNPSFNDALLDRLNFYLNGDKIFSIEDHSSNRILDDATAAAVNIPIRQISILLIIFSGLLGLLTYVKDSERNIYIALKGNKRLALRLETLTGSILPMLLTGIICCLVTYKNTACIFPLLLSAVGAVIFSVFPGILFKKSSSLARLLPVIMLILITLVVLYN